MERYKGGNNERVYVFFICFFYWDVNFMIEGFFVFICY